MNADMKLFWPQFVHKGSKCQLWIIYVLGGVGV